MTGKRKINYYSIEPALKEQADTIVAVEEGIKKYLTSRYFPKKQMLEELGTEFGNKQTRFVLVGFGMGYMLEEIIKQVGKQVNVLVVEKDDNLLTVQQERVKFEEQPYPYVQYIVPEQNSNLIQRLEQFIPVEEMLNVKLVVLKSYQKIYPEWCAEVVREIRGYLAQLQIRSNTTINIKKLGIENTLANRKAMEECHDLEKHRNKYNNVPALIVSAGPSLDKNIDLIKNFKGIIFCAGRTLTPVMAQGVRPDFVVSVDPYNEIYETFGKRKEHDIPLITIVEGNKKVVETSYGPKYMLHNTGVVQSILGLRVNPTLELYGTVASLCLSSAEYMGCSPIIFIGQDLAYTNNNRHSIHASDDLIGLGSNAINKEAIKTKYQAINGYDGQEVYSDDLLISYLRWIEEFIANKKGHYINCTEGGAYIEGAEHIPFGNCIKRYCIAEKPEIQHEKLEGNEGKNPERCMQDILIQMRELIEVCGMLKLNYERLIDEQVLYSSRRKREIEYLMYNINHNEEEILNSENGKAIFDILIEDIALLINMDARSKEPLYETDRERVIRNSRLNFMFYEAMEAGIKTLADMVEKELKKG